MSELLNLLDANALKMLLAIFFVLALSAWAGSAVSRRQRKADPAKDEGLKIVLGATLSLFGLLMGFLLSFAISGYNTRVSAEENEAMALANAFQRTTLLPTISAQQQAETLLEEYLVSRIAFYHAADEAQRAALRMQSIQLQTKMWNFVSEAAKKAPNPVSVSLVEACGQLYITQQKTMASWRHQIPMTAWLILIVFGVCSHFLIGYHMRAGSQAWLLVVPFVTALALFMISEIDVPGKGVIHVTPQNLEALQVTLSKGGLTP
ncbi:MULTISPECIES: hypothetical protein [unclassified Pusillimonas]|uniref:bestrophin-like domain n=1 Tax=unclassified Pusillimonas TaxID=2640016 RepID=UPI000B9D1486|nr:MULTISPECIES: hypothetical protein [unclassified Pusillimonas]OXR49727.1 hypothetical protein PuT2_08100 [Pusillimonas sp. T2]ROT45129.1 hypothetical protein CHR62_09815 [Pusillimonas sp. NJUB218]